MKNISLENISWEDCFSAQNPSFLTTTWARMGSAEISWNSEKFVAAEMFAAENRRKPRAIADINVYVYILVLHVFTRFEVTLVSAFPKCLLPNLGGI